MIKVFQLNDCEWYAAETLDEAKQCFFKTCGMDEEDLDEPHELTDQAMGILMFLTDMENRNSPRHSFREELAIRLARGETFPQPFATSEY